MIKNNGKLTKLDQVNYVLKLQNKKSRPTLPNHKGFLQPPQQFF